MPLQTANLAARGFSRKIRNKPLTLSKPIVALIVCALLTSALSAAAPGPISPVREEGELVLFDAARDGPEVFHNYTASWKEGSNLVPVTRQVTKSGEKFVEISYEKERGTAISLIRFESLPKPARGMRYNGIRLVIDYDKDDYSHISVSSSFSDNTQLTSRLVLEQGTNEYLISSGFRRAKFPPDWNRLSWILTVRERTSSPKATALWSSRGGWSSPVPTNRDSTMVE